MPFCPACRSEYREAYTRCADCGVDLVAALPPDPAAPSGLDWAEIFNGPPPQADVLRSALEAADIETQCPDAFVSTLGWYAPGSFNFIRVFVKASELERAREILKAPHPPPPDP
jgi:hypothetical protein